MATSTEWFSFLKFKKMSRIHVFCMWWGFFTSVNQLKFKEWYFGCGAVLLRHEL
jgi:hypothetical protein